MDLILVEIFCFIILFFIILSQLQFLFVALVSDPIKLIEYSIILIL